VSPDFEFAIVGSGFSGLCMAIRLQKAGRRSFVILEKADAVGGTWRDNDYPGCACDVPSHLYSFSFEQNPRWTRMFAPQVEIRQYLEHCVEKFALRPHLRLGVEVSCAEYDEAGAFWRVRASDGTTLTARHLVLGLGPLHRPALPAIEGLERFRGAAFHSARWDHQRQLRGQRVGLIGTGASAIQIVPQIAGLVERLVLFQRTPPWVLPKPDREITQFERRLFAAAPAAQRLYRWFIYYLLELRGLGFTVHPKVMGAAARLGRAHIRRQIADPELRRAVTPDYMPGCKRILIADDYYPTLARPNVELVTAPIARATERGLVMGDGTEHELDTIIYGTGFRVTDVLTPLRVIGRGGVELNDASSRGMEAYLGTLVSGFPNLFMLLGPNTGLGHNSMVFMIESQVELALRCAKAIQRRGARSVHVRDAAQRAFNQALQPRLQRAIWASGCQSWYLNGEGRNMTMWPGFTFEFWARTRRLDESVLEFDPAPLRDDALPRHPRPLPTQRSLAGAEHAGIPDGGAARRPIDQLR
jgi:cation diffusion facilitator CzcD-associated flavoprotein CzcO